MVTKISTAVNSLRKNRIYDAATKIIFPICIVLYGLYKVNLGIDITDSAYSLSNFKFANSLYSMWYFSIFFANLVGQLLMGLPGGATLLGMNIYSGLIKIATALIAYFFFTKKVGAAREGVFAATLTALGLCWCPTTILYNYLSYFFFVIAAVLLYKGIMDEKNRYLLLAGIMLGLNVFVRLPNLAEIALIAALWIDALYQRTKFKEWVHKTHICIYGFLAGLVPGIALIGLTRGYKEYINGISDLFGMTSEASDYSTVEMVLSILKSYWHGLNYTKWLIALCIVGAVLFKVLPERHTWLKHLSCTLFGMAYILYLRKAQVVFLDFSSIYFTKNLAVVALWIINPIFVYVMFSKRSGRSDRILATISLVMLFVSPLGGNNELYSTMNCMFIALPFFVKILTDFSQKPEYVKGFKFTAVLPIAFFMVFALLFGTSYAFRDGLDAPMDTYVTNNPVIAHVKTTQENAARLEAVSQLFADEQLNRGTLLLYGEVSGMGFYLDTRIAIDTPWPSLRSYTVQKFEVSMNMLSDEIEFKGESIPTVIVSAAEYEQMMGDNPSRKQEILKNFLQKYSFNIRYNDNVMYVFTSN